MIFRRVSDFTVPLGGSKIYISNNKSRNELGTWAYNWHGRLSTVDAGYPGLVCQRHRISLWK